MPIFITKIKVYNGDDLIKTFTGDWGGVNYQELSFDLGSKVIFNKGILISINTLSSPSTTESRFATLSIKTVGAYFTEGANIPLSLLLLND